MTIPTLNVNLKKCDCWPNGVPVGGKHFATCSAAPILLPCHIPRTVEMTVRLGECNMACHVRYERSDESHSSQCAAMPIRFTCTIGGDGTWAGSKPLTFTMPDGSEAPMVIADACRAAWEIVVALVTGKSVTTKYGPEHPILKQRDAVFEALAKMAQAEEAHLIALCDYLGSGLPEDVQVEVGHKTPPRQSPIALAAYVSHLIAKVGAL